MSEVYPIWNLSHVKDIGNYLKINGGEYGERNYMLWLFAVNTGLRISDILPRKVEDVRDKNGNLRDEIKIIEKKTEEKESRKGKPRVVMLPDDLKRNLKKYIKHKEDYELLFASRNGKNKPLTRQRVDQIFRPACNAFGYSQIGCHTTRKTYGYALYIDNDKDIYLVQSILGHADIENTKKYIGLGKLKKEKAIHSLNFSSR